MARWAHLMLDTIEWQRRASYDAHGQATFGTAAELRCRVVNKNRMTRTATGQEAISTTTIYLDGDPGVAVDDRITLPDGTVPAILNVLSYPDRDGHRHQEVLT